MKIVFINRFFHPDLAPTGRYAADVAFDLAAAGHDVHAVTSRLAYDGNVRSQSKSNDMSQNSRWTA